ncbi:MAG: tetratricopeptide repeat protein, partial [Bacteroidetes bacterium]|nr:tetratricopeptide repeat protein [Bacteroidota bacterium]
MSPRYNPYIAGIPVGTSGNFIGRADILHETKRTLSDPNQNAITLFGQRRIGKTSILQYLTKNLSQQGNFRAVFFDLEDRAAKPLGKVVEELANTIANSLKLPKPKLGKNPEIFFQTKWLPDVLDNLQSKTENEDMTYSLVLLFDEFDVLADPQAGQAVRDFFPYLRDLLSMDRRRLKFIFTLGRNLGDLSQVASSLFKGIPNKRVSLLSKEEAFDLVRFSEKQNDLAWDDAAVQKIWELTNGHPFLTQALCWEIWQRKYDSSPKTIARVESTDVDTAIDPTLEKSRNALDWLWQGLGPAEKVVAAALAQIDKKVVTQEDIENILNESGVVIIIRELSEEAPKRLEEWDLIEPVEGGYRFRVELLRLWIAEHYPLNTVQQELDEVQPVAESLYQAARSLFNANKFDNAASHLIDAIGYNPNHRGASEMLAEIYIKRDELDKAQELLENLINSFPTVAKPTLAKVYLMQASKSTDDDQKLSWYQKVLDIYPNQSTAQNAFQKIWRKRGEVALNAKKFEEALNAYQLANDEKMIASINTEINALYIKERIKRIKQLELENKIEDALSIFKELEDNQKELGEWKKTKERLLTKKKLYETYQQALGAISQKNNQKASELLLEVLNIQKDYENAAELLSEIITQEKIIKNELAKQVAKSKERAEIEYKEKERLEIETKEKVIRETKKGVKLTKEEKKEASSTTKKVQKSVKELKAWNPFSFIVYLFWVLFFPNARINYINELKKDAEVQARWVTATLLVLPSAYLQTGVILGYFPSVIDDAFPVFIIFSVFATIILWLLAGLSGNKSFAALILSPIIAILLVQSSWTNIITVSVIWFLSNYLMASSEAIVSKIEDYSSLLAISYIFPAFGVVTFAGWYVANVLFDGSFFAYIGAFVALVFMVIVVFVISLLIISILSAFLEKDPLEKKGVNWSGIFLVTG